MKESTRLWKRAYNTWRGMLRRCGNPLDAGYPNYGGRGISVCEAWTTFPLFFDWFSATYIEGRSIDRADNDEGYSPGNCRWATKQEQMKNRRVTDRWRAHLLAALETRRAQLAAAPVPSSKKCYVCKSTKPLGEFYRLTKSRDGRGRGCVACMRISGRGRKRKKRNRCKEVLLLKASTAERIL